MSARLLILLGNPVRTFTEWRQRRNWAAMHLEWLRTMVYGDARWLALNPIASALTQRYEAALRDDWYALDHEDTPRLRTRLGLDPSRATGRSQAPSSTRLAIEAVLQAEYVALVPGECVPLQTSAPVTYPGLEAIYMAGMQHAVDASRAANAQQAGAPQVDGWSGWACQYPNKLPRLYGARPIAEVNCDEENGDRLLFLVEASGVPACPHCGKPLINCKCWGEIKVVETLETKAGLMLKVDRGDYYQWEFAAAPAQQAGAVEHSFKCYSCQREWAAMTATSDCPAEGCGTTNSPVASNPAAQQAGAPLPQAPNGVVAHWTDGWSPIKSAPRDGTNILIRFGEHDGISQAKYIAGLPHPWQFIDTNDGVTWLINHSVDAPGGPSHWRHLDAATRAQPQADAAGEPVQWGDPETVGMFIRQLQTIDPAAPIYAAFHAEYKGKRRAMVRGVTLSRERVKGRFIETGDTSVPYTHVVWSQPQADAAARDAQRLDYLQVRAATVEILPEGPGWEFRIGGLHKAVSHDVRSAIDAAIAAQAPGAWEDKHP